VHAFIVKGFVYRGWLLKVTHFEMDAKSMRERNNAQANTNQSSQVFLMCMPETCLSVCVRLCVRVSVCVQVYVRNNVQARTSQSSQVHLYILKFLICIPDMCVCV